jgi:branched-chain amino acid aminotransferase
MNIFFVYGGPDGGRLVTPATSGTILEGITRASLLEIAGKQGLTVEERPVAFSEWVDGVASGEITEVFACGTAAVITPVGELLHEGGSIITPQPGGPVTTQLRSTLVDMQFGRTEDAYGWTRQFA